MTMQRQNIFFLITICSILFISELNGQDQNFCDNLILWGETKLHEKKYSQSLNLLIKAHELAEKNEWKIQQFKALNNIGKNYLALLDYDEALRHFLKAHDIAQRHLSSNYLAGSLINIGILYSTEGRWNETDRSFNEALKVSINNNDSTLIGLCFINLATSANKQNKSKNSILYTDKAKKYIPDSSNLDYSWNVIRMETLYLEHRDKEAKDIAFKIAPQLEKLSKYDNLTSILITLSNIYTREDNYKEAISLLHRALNYKPNIEKKLQIYNNLAELSQHQNELKQVIEYQDSVIMCKDSLYNQKKISMFENSQIKLNLENSQKELLIKNIELKNRKIQIIAITLSFVLFILILVVILWHKYEKNKRDKIFMQQQQEKYELEQKILKNEVEHKNRELTTKALSLYQHNELINEVINSFVKLHEEQPLDNKILEILKTLKKKLKEKTKQDSFTVHFMHVNQHFIDALNKKHPELTSKDIRFLSYIYMNLNTKEIASLLNITQESFRTKKMRISKKLNLESSALLYDYIKSL